MSIAPYRCCRLSWEKGWEKLFTEQELKVQRGKRHCLRLHSRPMLTAVGVGEGSAGARPGSVAPESGNGLSFLLLQLGSDILAEGISDHRTVPREWGPEFSCPGPSSGARPGHTGMVGWYMTA